MFSPFQFEMEELAEEVVVEGEGLMKLFGESNSGVLKDGGGTDIGIVVDGVSW
jgi:hypothetical protein